MVLFGFVTVFALVMLSAVAFCAFCWAISLWGMACCCCYGVVVVVVVVVVERWGKAAIVVVLVVIGTILGHCWVGLVIVVEEAEIVESDSGSGVGEGIELRS